jgi:hypothetical protein
MPAETREVALRLRGRAALEREDVKSGAAAERFR